MYQVAIPSYQRPNILKNKTIKLLQKYNIDTNIITIFVANQEEHDIYLEAFPNLKIIIGKLGITNQRNFIRNYFNIGDNVLFFDDDIEELLEYENEKNLKPVENLNQFIIDSFNECMASGSHLWGIYPVANPYFMKSRPLINKKLSFIIGCMFGQIIRHCDELNLNISCETKEDLLNSILHYQMDGVVVRFDRFTIKTKFYNKIGGLGSAGDRSEKARLASEYLEENYSKFGKSWIRKDGRHEFKLKRIN